MIVCRTLGPVSVEVDGAGAPTELMWRKNIALVVYLARSPKRARTRDHLIGVFWGDKAQDAARHSLNHAAGPPRPHQLEGGARPTPPYAATSPPPPAIHPQNRSAHRRAAITVPLP